MVDVQPENGYCRIANELMEAMIQIRIPGESMQCLLVIFRETYGYNRTSRDIPNKQFEAKTGICKQHIKRAIQKLIDMNLISVTNNGTSKQPIYKINKNYDSWKKLPKKVTVTNNGYESNPKRLQQLPIMITNSDELKTNKDTLKTKDPQNSPTQPFLSLSLYFHQRQKESGLYHSDFKKNLTEKSKIVIDGAICLEKLNRIDGESIDDIQRVLDFIVTDDDGQTGIGWHGWKRNVVSATSLRNRNNGPSKYFKIKNQMPRKQEIKF